MTSSSSTKREESFKDEDEVPKGAFVDVCEARKRGWEFLCKKQESAWKLVFESKNKSRKFWKESSVNTPTSGIWCVKMEFPVKIPYEKWKKL